MKYPKFKYHPEKQAVLVKSEADEKDLGSSWHDSPAAWGHESAPSFSPCPKLAKVAEDFKKKGSAKKIEKDQASA